MEPPGAMMLSSRLAPSFVLSSAPEFAPGCDGGGESALTASEPAIARPAAAMRAPKVPAPRNSELMKPRPPPATQHVPTRRPIDRIVESGFLRDPPLRPLDASG